MQRKDTIYIKPKKVVEVVMQQRTFCQIAEAESDEDEDREYVGAGGDKEEDEDELEGEDEDDEEPLPTQQGKKPSWKAPPNPRPSQKAPAPRPSEKAPVPRPTQKAQYQKVSDVEDNTRGLAHYDSLCGMCQRTWRDCKKAPSGGSCLTCKEKKYKCEYMSGRKMEREEEEEIQKAKPRPRKMGKVALKKAPEPEP